MRENYLDEALTEYGRSDYYPFHMPGHKRQRLGDFLPEEIDITEIEGFDNLHHAEGILREGQERLARLFGADESFYLVNGSTAGILAAVCGCIRKGDRILIGRNCHKAVYHAAYLMEAKAEYLYPKPTDFGIQGSIAPGQVEKMLAERKEVRAVVITSPTYDGVVSDIRAIAEIVDWDGIPLIVD
ncbi:MAG: aminotransferase class V-fold PLP-dependent enzyme, partial [Clostridiales bacterium]|nr:aminotransferase class V-fold PLP-dependent enzyme [Clostridiales bacterium]